MPEPSASYVSMLQLMDPLLSVRWGGTIEQWVVERKAMIPDYEITYLRNRRDRTARWIREGRNKDKKAEWARVQSTHKELVEEYGSAMAGKRVIRFSTALDNRLYNELCMADIKRYGGYSRLADEWDKQDEKEDAETARAQREEGIAKGKEVYDILNFLERKRTDQLLNGERDLKKLLGVTRLFN